MIKRRLPNRAAPTRLKRRARRAAQADPAQLPVARRHRHADRRRARPAPAVPGRVPDRCPHLLRRPLWDHNPYLTPLDEDDPDVRVVDCDYPLIHQSNFTPYHFLHGFIEDLNRQLGLDIRPTEFRGDIHISDRERQWFSRIEERAQDNPPFWLVTAGGKYDFTAKWWDHGRYQQVVDHFRGRIEFVQVGDRNHNHPPLEGVVDLRGETTLRHLVRLMYHAQGALSPVSLLMHLAAAVPVRPGMPQNRPCVVVAGGPGAGALGGLSAPPVHPHGGRAALLRQRRLLEVPGHPPR